MKIFYTFHATAHLDSLPPETREYIESALQAFDPRDPALVRRPEAAQYGVRAGDDLLVVVEENGKELHVITIYNIHALQQLVSH